ncbi:hypothetical protein AMTRI_Chr11g156510 [Amborella trichopoda]
MSPAGFLQPLPIPLHVWTDLSMDFIDGLPNCNGKTTIYVVVDRLSKATHFIPISHPYTATSVAQIFLTTSLNCMYGMPKVIICDRDPIFTSAFWKNCLTCSTALNFSSAYHPQTEVANCTVEMYLKWSDRPKEWARWIAWAKYCYNTSVHSATKKTPYEMVYGRAPPTLLSYIPGTTQVE